MTKSHTSARDLVLCAMFSALIAIGAFIRITLPTEPYAMHFTLQWFFVLTAALLLGERGAFLSVLVYLLLGLAGLPVFASGGGLSYIARPTFGFLLGFLPAAWVSGFLSRHAGKLAERKKPRRKAGKTEREACSKVGREEQELSSVNDENRKRRIPDRQGKQRKSKAKGVSNPPLCFGERHARRLCRGHAVLLSGREISAGVRWLAPAGSRQLLPADNRRRFHALCAGILVGGAAEKNPLKTLCAKL